MNRLICVAVGVFVAASAVVGGFRLDFRDDGVGQWRVVLDGVMGGLSSGQVTESADGALRFSGVLSLENNGGFSQMRTNVPVGAFEKAGAVEWRVKGDGRTYNFDIRTADVPVMAGSYQVEFDTVAGEWMTFRARFEDFTLFSFGREVRSARELRPDQIESMGVTLSDKQVGPFRLDIEFIRAVDLTEMESERRDMEMSGAGRSDVAQLFSLAIKRGVPLFNDGNTAACAAVYEVAISAAVELGGQAIGERMAAILTIALEEGRREHDARERAWIYRRAMDGAMAGMMRMADA